MPPDRKRKSRSNSRSRHSDDRNSPSSPKRRPSMDNDKLQSILQTLQSLQNDVTYCNGRLTLFQSRFEQQKTAFEPACVTDYDAISLLGSEDITLDSVTEEGAIKPSNEAELPTNLAIKPPNKVIKPSNEATKPPNDTSSPGNVNLSSNENTECACYDPDASATSWKPSNDFFSFLQKNSRRKLSYYQVLDVLETNSVLSVDALTSPTLDPAIINQISNPQTKTYAQERDKEMVYIQCSLLTATGPLCCLHALESNDTINVSNKDVKLMLEQILCLLGSANYHISVLRRKKVLVAMNKAKANLGDLPLPNAKILLFGDNFSSLASKQADPSRGLSKTLSSNARRQFSSSTQFVWIQASPHAELL